MRFLEGFFPAAELLETLLLLLLRLLLFKLFSTLFDEPLVIFLEVFFFSAIEALLLEREFDLPLDLLADLVLRVLRVFGAIADFFSLDFSLALDFERLALLLFPGLFDLLLYL